MNTKTPTGSQGNEEPPWSAIVTGGANGIGAACVRKLASRGINVLIADVADENGQKLARQVSEEFGVQAIYQHVDVRKEEGIEAMVQAAVEKWGRLDFACNSAGINKEFDVKENDQNVSVALFDLTYEINQRGVWLCQRAEAAAMLKQEPRPVEFSPAPPKEVPAQRGSIVNISSSSSVTAVGYPAYTASKHSVLGITRNGAYFYGPHGIRVNAVAPGGTGNTQLMLDYLPAESHQKVKDNDGTWAKSNTPLQKGAWPEEVANVISFLLSAESSHVTGVNLEVDGGFVNTKFGSM